MSQKTVSIIGGDLRQLTLARLLTENGFYVKLFGWCEEMSSEFFICDSVIEATNTDILIFPMPMNVGSFVFAPFSGKEILVEDILCNLSYKTKILGGKIPANIADRLKRRKIEFADYLKREELAIKNAVPTAEGALEIAMREIPVTIHNSKCLVTGYGRIAKILAKMLKNLGSDVTVAARRIDARAEAEADSFKTCDIPNLKDACKDCDCIFNTAPALLFDNNVISGLNEKTVLIDLASKPGGVDFECAKKAGLNVIWALSLPGKVAPITSGKIIFETVMNILNEFETKKE